MVMATVRDALDPLVRLDELPLSVPEPLFVALLPLPELPSSPPRGSPAPMRPPPPAPLPPSIGMPLVSMPPLRLCPPLYFFAMAMTASKI